MTLREDLHQMLAETERKHGPNDPWAQALRRQLAEIEQETKSPTEKSWLMHYSAGMRWKSKPGSKSSNEPPSQPTEQTTEE